MTIWKAFAILGIHDCFSLQRLHNMRSGVIFTTEGISGAKYKRTVYGEAIIEKTFQRDDVVVFDITKEDVKNLSQGANLLSLLLRKYENTRFK